MGSVLRFKFTNVPRQEGEQARLKVVQGPDYGTTYVLTSTQATVGRGEENEIVISDLKASRRHAEFALTERGWMLRDLGSANGVSHNGKPARDASLSAKDIVTLGETVLEFVPGEAATKLLLAPPRTAAVARLEQAHVAAEKEKQRTALESARKMARGAGKRGSMLLLLGVAGAGAYLFTGNGTTQPVKVPGPRDPTVAGDPSRDLASYLPPSDPTPAARTADKFFKAGFREYRERNYLRAETQFRTATEIDPSHQLAKLYLGKCETDIKDEIQANLDAGKKSLDAGKLNDARGHFEAVMRLLYRDQANTSFIEAREQLEKVNKRINGLIDRGIEGES